MKAKDLMQGDYITFKDALKDGIVVPVKIVGLGYVGRGVEDEALVEINGDKSCDIIEIDDECVGIPLTPEILEKNGFEKWEQPRLTTLWAGYGKDNEDDLEVTFVESNNSISVKLDVKGSLLMTMNVNYVHELQHAFRLCGIDKEIEL